MRLFKQKTGDLLFCIAVLLMLVVGFSTYKDYAKTVDESVERHTEMLNYRYICKTLFGREIGEVPEDWFEESDEPDDLEHWKDRYYGIFLELPLVAVEDLTGFTIPIHRVYQLRHLYTFLLCLCGWICFYLFCRKVFQSSWMGLLGMLMLTLYPRFWGEQFTNSKDLVFTATCCACLFGTAMCLEHEGKWRYEVLMAFVSALCANTRFLGFQFPALLFGYRLIRDWALVGVPKGAMSSWVVKKGLRYLFQLVMVLLFYFLITPASWSAPFSFLKGVFGTFSNYTIWDGEVLFLGKYYPGNALPWYYIPVWIFLSVPLWYLLLCGLGTISVLRKDFSRRGLPIGEKVRGLLLSDHRYLVLCLVVALIPFLTHIVKEVTLYNSWRHVYYVTPMLVVLALFGFQRVMEICAGKRIWRRVLAGAACLLLCGQVGWTALNHPYEKVYFNPVGRAFAEQVDRDYWFESNYQQLKTILRNDSTRRIHTSGENFVAGMIQSFLPYEEQIRFYRWYGYPDKIEYIIDLADTVEPETFDGFTPVHEVRMHDGLVLSTLHLRDDVLRERFGGMYPEDNIRTKNQ